MSVLAGESGDVLSRYHFEPGHFTASGFVISPDRALVLLVWHERLGLWVQPGGHIEPGDEDLEFSARREIVEETGLADLGVVGDGLFDIDVHHIPAARGEPGHEHHDVRFLFEASGEPVAGGGIREAAWVPVGEVARLTADHSVLRAVEKLL
jgi:8-oxo-dGTP pyrophosphatase MutT (NUDIX family)